MAIRSVSTGAARVAEAHPEKRVSLAFMLTGLLALSAGVFLGPLQALNYAGVDFYQYNLPFLESYYQGLTLHGVMNAIVFTTFFITGLLLYLPARALDLRPSMVVSWAAYGMMILGLGLAGYAMLSNTSTVLYTFYPPLQGHWAFYLGAGLIVLGSLVVGFEVWRMWRRWKAETPGKPTPLVAYMSLLTWLMWMLCSLGLVTSVVVFLLPWSLGLREGVDPLLARTLFWFTGHAIVYFWLLPAYVAWYAFIPRQAGGKLVSDPLARLAFLMFLLFSIPVGFHHQYSDPGIPAAWKLVHNVLTMFISIPSLLTAFTVAASLENAGKANGGRGMFHWIGKLPWKEPGFTAPVLAMTSFIFGGAGGMVNAGFNLNAVVHNTAWIPGHFHITVGTATTLTFMGITYWLIPHLTRRRLVGKGVALLSSWLWFIGMMIFALGMHWQGLLGVPRRTHIANMLPELAAAYQNARVPAIITGISGAILFIAGISFFYVLLATLFTGERLSEEETPSIPYAETVSGPEGKASVQLMERVGLWFLVAVIIVAIAYAPTIIDQLRNFLPISGMRLW